MNLNIHAGRKWSTDMTIISDDGATGEILNPNDTGTFMVQSVGDNPTCIIPPVQMTIIDLNNGLFNITLSKEQTALLIQDVAFAEDKYQPQNSYLGVMEFILDAGDRGATVPLYVIEVAECLVV